MKIARHSKAEDGPRFTLVLGSDRRDARHAGEALALIEAQNLALAAGGPTTVRVADEEFVLYTVARDADGTITTTTGAK